MKVPALLGKLATTLVLVAAPAAVAAEFEVAPGTVFDYREPVGLCVIDAQESPAFEVVTEFFERLEGESVQGLLLLYDCPYVEALRNEDTQGVEPSAWLRVLAAKNGDRLARVERSRAAFLSDVAADFAGAIDAIADRKESIQPRIDRAVELLREIDPSAGQIELGEMRSLGMIGQDSYAVYTGVLSRPVAAGQVQPVLSVLALTTVEGYVITVASHRPFAGEEGLEPLLAQTQDFVADLIERNDPAGESRGGQIGIDWSRVLRSALVGAVVALCAVVVMKLWSKRGQGKKA